jgi:hypothetical protein
MTVDLQPFQYDFVYSKARHPAFAGGWCVGKTLSAIARSRIYSKLIPNNLGIIFRKTFRSLADSTLKDFERYTNLTVDGSRNYTDANGSVTMFRHIDELDSINQQNINLGWFYIEQGDELDSDREFFMLFGRLRRQLEPTPEFIKLKLPVRSGWVIANAGDHWMKELWLKGKLAQIARDIPDFQGQFAQLINVKSTENIKHIPPDTLASWQILKKASPAIYEQFVENNWDIGADQFIVIPSFKIDELEGIHIRYPDQRRIVSCDPSSGGDECVIYYMENWEVQEELLLHEKDTMKIAGHIKIMGEKHNINDYAIDSIGIGMGIADRLREMGCNVQYINSAEKPENSQYSSLRTEMWWHAQQLIFDKKIPYPKDPELRKQLSAPRYKVVNSNGLIQLEPKEKTKERLGYSPDRADAFIYGLYGTKYVQPYKHRDRWRDADDADIGSVVRSAMAA